MPHVDFSLFFHESAPILFVFLVLIGLVVLAMGAEYSRERRSLKLGKVKFMEDVYRQCVQDAYDKSLRETQLFDRIAEELSADPRLKGGNISTQARLRSILENLDVLQANIDAVKEQLVQSLVTADQ